MTNQGVYSTNIGQLLDDIAKSLPSRESTPIATATPCPSLEDDPLTLLENTLKQPYNSFQPGEQIPSPPTLTRQANGNYTDLHDPCMMNFANELYEVVGDVKDLIHHVERLKDTVDKLMRIAKANNHCIRDLMQKQKEESK